MCAAYRGPNPKKKPREKRAEAGNVTEGIGQKKHRETPKEERRGKYSTATEVVKKSTISKEAPNNHLEKRPSQN